MPQRVLLPFITLLFTPLALGADTVALSAPALDRTFHDRVDPFIVTYCVECHGREKPEAELDLSAFKSTASVANGFGVWELVTERLDATEMPPAKAKKQPSATERREVINWIQALRTNEAKKNAGDPGPILARRLSNAEFEHTIRDLTGADIRPTREFPVDPANQAGFDNSGESLSMSPALLTKYLQAARTVAEHLVLKPDGFAFAPHPVVADTDRDKYAVLRIVDFYRRQPTDLADYFFAAWHHEHRAEFGNATATVTTSAAKCRVSAKYLQTLLDVLRDSADDVGPLARLRELWRKMPTASGADASATARENAVTMREFVTELRGKLVPQVKNLTAPEIQGGSQTLVLWKNRQMAANRRRFDSTALQTPETAAELESRHLAAMDGGAKKTTTTKLPGKADKSQKNGTFLAPVVVTTGSSATSQMATLRQQRRDMDLAVPAEPDARAAFERAFARFANVFPDAFYITERARVYLDAAKEQDNSGRLLSAGLHSMTGYFRDDDPLYDLVLDEAGRRELDLLWREFDFSASVPQRMHLSMLWFERTDSSFLRDPEFDPYRPEDKSVTEQSKIARLAELYLAKAVRGGSSETVQRAITEHFEAVAANIRRVEEDRLAAEPSHLNSLLVFAERAYRRPLTADERSDLGGFYRTARQDNGLDHEEAMRDCIVSVLMSPNFCYRIDLIEASAAGATAAGASLPLHAPLSDFALANRLSYFLWSSMPDAGLLATAARGELRQPAALAAQAKRMLRDERARDFVREFAGQWLEFRRFEEHNAVDRERFPAFDNELRTAMSEEPLRFFVNLMREDRPVLDFLYGDYTFVNAPLARHYGMPEPKGAATDWVRVDRATEFGRGGLLPMAVFLTANSPGLRTSPVKRGYWVVRRVLGERIPPPPPNVPDLPNDEKNLGDLTLREVLERHRAEKNCASCHARFDSFGLVFEGYGPVGERRARDIAGRPVDTRAEFPGGPTGQGLTGLRDYIQNHRENDFVENLCRKLAAYGLGRTLLMSDDALIAEMKTKLVASGHHFATLIETIVTSPQFRNKRVAARSAPTAASAP